MNSNPRQALVGDIGGTHARFAITDIDELTISDFVMFRSEMFESLQAAIRSYMESIPHRPAMAGFAIAGPVDDETLRLTNLPWSFTRDELRDACGADRVNVVNDFEALALALPCLTPHDLEKIGGGEPDRDGVRAVYGPGTGMGVAALAASPSGWIGIGTEGGHVSFPVETAEELDIVERIRGGEGHLSVERLLSGPGLLRLYEVLSELKDKPAKALPVADIVAQGMDNKDATAREALELFAKWLGRFGGDLALLYGARGGLYLGGGIAPRILPLLAGDAFRTPFLAKGRLSTFLERIPVHVIKSQEAGLKGAAVALAASVAAA